MLKESLISEINIAISDRYIILSENSIIDKIEEIKPEELTETDILLLKRNNKFNINESTLNGWKTILITLLANKEELEYALRWAAITKEALLDPESSDLYLLILFENYENIAEGSCIRIETTEQFCRKFVLRPNETVQQLINRTFLKSITELRKETRISDPLSSALSSTALKHNWLNISEQSHWRKLFLTGKAGCDIIDELFL